MAAALAILAQPTLRAPVLSALNRLSPWAVLAAIPGQVASLALCGAALWSLNPGAGLWANLGSRLLRDAGGNLVAAAPGVGELAGARALMLAGGATLTAVAVSAVDVFAETVAQIPFALAAIAATAHAWRAPTFIGLAAAAIGAMGVLGAVLLIALHDGLRRRLLVGASRARATVRRMTEVNRRGLASAVALHAGAWAMGGVQVWCVAIALGLHLPLQDAVLLESFVYTARAVAFAAPAGLGVQEGAFVAAGLAFGLRPDEALAISIALRCRDLLFGAPALLAWPIFELRLSKARSVH